MSGRAAAALIAAALASSAAAQGSEQYVEPPTYAPEPPRAPQPPATATPAPTTATATTTSTSTSTSPSPSPSTSGAPTEPVPPHRDPAALPGPAAPVVPPHRPDPALVSFVRAAPLSDLPRLATEDPRLRALDSNGRLQLVRELRPGLPSRTAGVVLNLVPGFGVGSLVQGDLAGAARQVGAELLSIVALVAGGALFFEDGTGDTGVTLGLLGIAGLVTARGAGAHRAAHYEGWRARALRRGWEAPQTGALAPRGVRLALEL